MKKKTIALILTALAVAGVSLAGCRKGGTPSGDGAYPMSPGLWFDTMGTVNGAGIGGANDGTSAPPYQYGSITETPFRPVSEETSSSYFSLDRNTAGYSYVRTQIENGYKISTDSVRIEELINYFDYSYPEPADDALSVTTYLSDCPWNEENKLLTVGVKTQTVKLDATNGNYVLLVDVSGSMSGDSRLGLAKKGFNMLIDSLGEGDVVSLVKYAGGMEVVADGKECTADGKASVKKSIGGLNAYGSTNGAGGLELAYQTAQKHFITGGNNRVIIVSDGDFNVGNSSVDGMKEFIQEKAKSGIYLSVIGVGMGNTRDDILETLATCGNGNYGYMDNETEAKKIFLEDLNGNLRTVAKDAKAGVTFSEQVEKYRLVGYDTKHLSKDEFDNVKTDAGEIGSGLCSTAVYELKLKEGATGEIAKAEIRYKDVRGKEEVNSSVTSTVTAEITENSDTAFISCVAEFGLILRKSEFKGTASLANVLDRLGRLPTEITANDPYKAEFIELIKKAVISEKY